MTLIYLFSNHRISYGPGPVRGPHGHPQRPLPAGRDSSWGHPEGVEPEIFLRPRSPHLGPHDFCKCIPKRTGKREGVSQSLFFQWAVFLGSGLPLWASLRKALSGMAFCSIPKPSSSTSWTKALQVRAVFVPGHRIVFAPGYEKIHPLFFVIFSTGTILFNKVPGNRLKNTHPRANLSFFIPMSGAVCSLGPQSRWFLSGGQTAGVVWGHNSIFDRPQALKSSWRWSEANPPWSPHFFFIINGRFHASCEVLYLPYPL